MVYYNVPRPASFVTWWGRAVQQWRKRCTISDISVKKHLTATPKWLCVIPLLQQGIRCSPRSYTVKLCGYYRPMKLQVVMAYLTVQSQLTYSMEQSPSWKANRFSASQEIPHFYGTRRFITAFTSARHQFLFWPRSIQSMPLYPTSYRSILILSSLLRLDLPSGLFPSGFPTKTLCTPLPSSIRATCLAHLILHDFITRTILGEEYRS